MSCTQKQQLVCFQKVRVYKPWFRHFNDHKDFRNEGTVHLFSLMALFSYANFRSNERVINGDRYMEAPGQWICKLGALPRILRVHSKAQALELMEYFQDHGFLTFEILDEEKEILRFTISDWKEHCTHLQYNYYSYKGSGFFFFPLPVGRLLLKIARKEVGIVFSELDAIMDMWLHTILKDPKVRGSEYMPVVYYSNMRGMPLLSYYGPRKLVTGEPAPDHPEQPTGGTGKIVLKKTAGGTTTGLAGARFSIYFNGQIVGSDITNAQGEIYVENAATGLWSFMETSAPDGFCVDPTPKSVYVDVSEGDREYSVAATNYELPDMKIIKRDAMSGKPIAGTVFSIKSVTGSYSTSVTTGTDGSATLSAIPAGVYVVREESVPEPYIVTNTEQTVALRPGKTSEVTFVDYEKPGLEIVKKNIANGEPIEGVTYRIEQIDGSFSTSATTDNHGRIFLASIPVGSYKVTEINVPSHVILSPIPQEVALKAGETSTVTFFNALKPTLEIRKVDSVTGDPVKGAKFQIWYGSNHTDTGELNDLGTYFSDASGKIILPEIKDGWYKVTELEPASGYAIKEPATQECFISGGESKVLTFENTPLSAIIIRKVDSESGQPLEGAWFRIRYLGGTSGTGGTVIGEYRTSSNGTIVVTSLKAGTYVCEEISAPDGYVITDATETVYLSGKD